MAAIITVGREFGSGGRELGMRLSDALGVPCFDQEALDELLRKHGSDPECVTEHSNAELRIACQYTVGRRFAVPSAASHDMKLVAAQRKVIKTLAERGDCVVVGHGADIILREMAPLNLFVYADQDTKLSRCLARADGDETMYTILRQIDRVEKERVVYRELLTGSAWGDKESYHLCINTSGKEIASLVPGVAAYVRAWFGAKDEWE